MTTYHWKAGVDGSWTTAADWAPTGGPRVQNTGPTPVSYDVAVFATSSTKAYTVTTGGLSDGLVVSGDHVTFDSFLNNDNGYGAVGGSPYGGYLAIKNGAVVTVTGTSGLSYLSYDQVQPSGGVTVDGATLISHGFVAGGSVAIENGSLFQDSGAGADVFDIGGTTLTWGSSIDVLAGARYTSELTSRIDGKFVVRGAGSVAHLVGVAGSGVVQVDDGASLGVTQAVSGAVQFDIGTAAALSFDNAPGGAGNTIQFTGEGGTLTLGSTETAPIVGFDASDSLQVSGVVTSAVWKAGLAGTGTLSLYSGYTVESVPLDGNYAGDTFKVVPVGAHESKITVEIPSAGPGATNSVMISAAAGNATLGSGMASGQLVTALAADVQAAGAPPSRLGSTTGASASGLPDTAYHGAAFGLSHTLSDGATITFVGGHH